MITFQGQRQFNVDLEKFAQKLGLLKSTVYQRMALEIWNSITKRAPVDTGRARSSFNLAIGAPDPTVPPPGTYGEPSPPNVAGIDGNEVVFITSNLDYIEPLENGHSKQAPGGMVFISVNEAVSRVQLYLQKMP